MVLYCHVIIVPLMLLYSNHEWNYTFLIFHYLYMGEPWLKLKDTTVSSSTHEYSYINTLLSFDCSVSCILDCSYGRPSRWPYHSCIGERSHD